MFFKFDRKGLPIPEREIEEVVTSTIDLINKLFGDNKEVYNDEEIIESVVEAVVTNSMEDSEIDYYYDLIKSHFLKEVRKRIAEKLKERGD